ncbi:MAG: chemotaxis protein CheA [Chitinivibrionales bacterium]|nr:chemotaxis protein CheA [Chitinivibrionales bacterium]
MGLQDKEMLNDLVVESREHLAEIEPDLLELEQKGDAISDALINRIFRAVHSIKGGFGFFGIEHITRLAHAMENVMSRVRDKLLAISPPVTDALLKGVDKLRVMLDDVGHAEDLPIEDEISGLNPFLSDAAPLSAPQAGTITAATDDILGQKHAAVTEAVVVDAIRNGKMLYEITINSKTDLADKNLALKALLESWEKLGSVLDIVPAQDAPVSADKEIIYSVVFSTVLEPDLVGFGTNVSNEQIYTIDVSAVKEKLKKAEGATAPKTGAPKKDGAQNDIVKDGKNHPVPSGESKIEDALRVKVGLLNNLMNLAGELVLSRNQLMQSVNRKLADAIDKDSFFNDADWSDEKNRRLKDSLMQSLSLRLIDIPGFNGILQNIDMVTSLLQESIMQTRLQPISVVFAKFPRLVRDLSKKLGKEVNLTLIGQDVELDKSIVEQLSDPLTHLIRNSVDHGIEMPQERLKSGKAAQGEVVLRAFHEGGKVHIQIEDDGAGIDRQRVKDKALQQGILTAEEIAKMSDREIDLIIMRPGFSTAEVISDVSGRGVGMDVVKTNVERLGGTIEIESAVGGGTVITMKLPLTLAIISSLIVSECGRRFAIPQVGIKELVRVRAKDITRKIERLKDCEVMRLRGKLLPLVRLSTALGMQTTFVDPETEDRKEDQRTRWSDRREERQLPEAAAATDGPEKERRRSKDRRTDPANAVKIIVLKFGQRHFGLVVEEVYESEEIVVKPLSEYLKTCQCYAGSTIMGDGSVAMILDTNGIAAVAGLKFNELEKEAQAEKDKFARESEKKHRELLLFSSGENNSFGVDLAAVARVEKVETSRISRVGNKEFLRYEDYSMRLLKLSDFLPVAAAAGEKESAFVIVPKGFKHPMGIIAEAVQDVVKTDLALDTSNIKEPGIAGSTIINAALTLVIDVGQIFKAAEPEIYE